MPQSYQMVTVVCFAESCNYHIHKAVGSYFVISSIIIIVVSIYVFYVWMSESYRRNLAHINVSRLSFEENTTVLVYKILKFILKVLETAKHNIF